MYIWEQQVGKFGLYIFGRLGSRPYSGFFDQATRKTRFLLL